MKQKRQFFTRSDSFFTKQTAWMEAQHTVWWDKEKSASLCCISPFMGTSIQSSCMWLSRNPLFIFCILHAVTYLGQNSSSIRIMLKLDRRFFEEWYRDCWWFIEMHEAYERRIEAFVAQTRFTLPKWLPFLPFSLLYQHLQVLKRWQNLFLVDEYVSTIFLYSMTYTHLFPSSNEYSGVQILICLPANTTVDFKSISRHARFILSWMIDSVRKNPKYRLLWRR